MIVATLAIIFAGVAVATDDSDAAGADSVTASYVAEDQRIVLEVSAAYPDTAWFDLTITGNSLTEPIVVKNKAFNANYTKASVTLDNALVDGTYNLGLDFQSEAWTDLNTTLTVGGPEITKIAKPTITPVEITYDGEAHTTEIADGTG